MDTLPYASHYRPFDELFHLEAPIRVLWGALERAQAASAYLLRGPTGVGKTTLAVSYAQAAACLEPRHQPYRACGYCESCRRVAAGLQPEVVLIQPAGEQTQIWQLWDRERRPPGLLEHTLPYTPVIGRKRVYIFERADTLNAAAANSMLKVLEEAPPYAVFLLLTPVVERILPTVLSRCQAIAVRPAPRSELEQWLVERYDVPAERAAVLAALADGLPGAAVRLAETPGAMDEVEECVQAAIRLATVQPLGALRVAEELRSLGGGLKTLRGGAEQTQDADQGEPAAGRGRGDRGGTSAVLTVVISVFRDLLSLSLDAQSGDVVHRDRLAEMLATARTRPSGHWMTSLEILMEAVRRLEQNVPAGLVTDWLATAIAAGVAPERRRTSYAYVQRG